MITQSGPHQRQLNLTAGTRAQLPKAHHYTTRRDPCLWSIVMCPLPVLASTPNSHLMVTSITKFQATTCLSCSSQATRAIKTSNKECMELIETIRILHLIAASSQVIKPTMSRRPPSERVLTTTGQSKPTEDTQPDAMRSLTSRCKLSKRKCSRQQIVPSGDPTVDNLNAHTLLLEYHPPFKRLEICSI